MLQTWAMMTITTLSMMMTSISTLGMVTMITAPKTIMMTAPPTVKSEEIDCSGGASDEKGPDNLLLTVMLEVEEEHEDDGVNDDSEDASEQEGTNIIVPLPGSPPAGWFVPPQLPPDLKYIPKHDAL